MSIILAGITLPDLIWEDQYATSKVAQTIKSTLGGNTILMASYINKGQLITLKSLDDQAWVTRDQVKQLQVLANTPNGRFTLAISGQVLTVSFAHQSPPAFDAHPIVYRSDTYDSNNKDYFSITLKLITV